MTAIEHTNVQEFIIKSSPYRKLKKFSYNILSQIFVAKYSLKPQLKSQTIFEVILNIILSLQIVSLAWYQDLDISNWSSFVPFLRIIGYVSYDSICADLGIMKSCFGITAFAIWSEVIFLFIFGIYEYLNKNPPKILTFIPIRIAHIFTTIGIIPSFMIMLIIFKYSIINVENIEEYQDGISAGDLNYGTFGIFFSLLSMILLFFINIFYELFTCDMKHSHSKTSIKARSSSELDLQRKAFYIAMCIFYVSFGKDRIVELQIAAFIISFGLMVKSIFVLQYFNVVENCIEIYKMAAISITLLIFLFGEAMDNTEIIVVFNIILQPIVAYFTIKFVSYKYKKLKENPESPRNQFEYERKFRHLFTRNHDLDAVDTLNLFTTYWNMRQFKKNKLFLIWEFDVCISIIKDERLARVKFSKISKAEFSIEGDIQEWKIFTWLKHGDCHKFSDINFMEFLLKFNKIKKKDEVICNILIQLCNEFSSKQPRIKKLINLVYRTGDYISSITENYQKITEKYKSAEAYDHYASFLENIASNIDEANLIHRKKNVLNINNFHGEYQSLESYGKDVGVLLISCSEEAFGTICYINDKASQILKTSIINASGVPLANFIPFPFGRLHDTLMKNFLKECERIDLPSHRSLCLQANDGFLVECYAMIHLTAFYDSTYFLVSFKPRSTSRQVAIISEENMILNHSELFSHYLGSSEQSLKNAALSDIIPRIYITKMQDYEPVIRQINDQRLAIVRIKKTIKSKSIYCFFVIHNENEIRKWQLGEDEDQLQNFYLTNNSNHDKKLTNINSFILTSNETSPKKLISKENETINQSFLMSEDKKIENLESMSKRSSSSKSSNINTNHARKLLFLSKRKIWMLQWALLIVILSVIITMVAVLSYIISDVSHTSKMSSLGDLGKLLYDYETITDWSRTIDKQVKTNSTSSIPQKIINIKYFLSILSDLESIQNVLLDHFRDWSFCDSSEIISKPIIPTWNFNTAIPQIENVNLYNGISNFIAESTKFISNINLNKDYLANLKYIFLNGISDSFDYTNRTTYDIVDCEINRILVTGTNINALIISGLFALGALFFVVLGFAVLVSKTYDQFWNFMLFKAQLPMAKLKASSIDRLMVVHGVDYNSETSNSEYVKTTNHKRTIKSQLYLKFMWKILIFFTIGASYYFLIYFYMYPRCENMMIKRPKLLINFNAKRVLISRLMIFGRECMSPYMGFNFPNSYDFPNARTMMDKTYDDLLQNIKETKEDNFSILMSQELKDRIYKSTNSSFGMLDYGSDVSVINIINEIHVICFQTPMTGTEYYPYIARVHAVQDEILDEFKLADHDSKNIINDQLNMIINATIIYSVTVFVLFFFYYWPYFNNQRKQFERFSVLPTILIMDLE